jgi:hypothetical protein
MDPASLSASEHPPFERDQDVERQRNASFGSQ